MGSLNKKVIQSILSSNSYIGSTEVLNICEVVTVEFGEAQLQTLKKMVIEGMYDKLTTLPSPKHLLGAELTVIRFHNERNKWFYAIYYDSIELFQDPQVLEIYPAK
jgi:hypothetical protein